VKTKVCKGGRKRKGKCRAAKGPGPCVKTKVCNGRRVCAQRGYGPMPNRRAMRAYREQIDTDRFNGW
jgi:hypothetical protein